MVYNDADDFVGHLAVMVTSRQHADIERFSQAGVGNGVYYPVLDHHQPAWTKHFVGVSLPNSEQLVNSVITLPCFPLLTEDEISRVCEVLQSL